MSIIQDGIWAASPTTTRGSPCRISHDVKGERIAYAVRLTNDEKATSLTRAKSNRSVFIRSIDRPNESRQYTAPTVLTVAQFSPSGAYIAVGDVNGSVRIWDCLGEGGLKGEYPITSGPINDIAWDGDSARIIAVGDGKGRYGHCFTADSGNSVGEILGHSAPINCVSIRQQRPLRAATGSDDTSIVFYHGAPFKFANTERGRHSRYIYGTAFSPDGTWLVSVGSDRKIWLYDGKTGEAQRAIGEDEPHTGSIFAVAWAADSKRVVTCSADQTVRVWDVETGKSTQMWRRPGEDTKVDIAHHQVGVIWPRPDLIISVDLEGNLNYFSFDSAQPTRIVKGHQKSITATCMTTGTLWTGSYDGRILAWDTAAARADTTDGQPHSNNVIGLAASSSTDNQRVYSIGWDDTVRTLDAETRSFVGDVAKTDGQPKGIAVASTADDGSVTLVAVAAGVTLYTDGKQVGFEKTKASPTCIAASGRIVAVGCEDYIVRLYQVSATTTLESLAEIQCSTAAMPCTLAFSPPTAKEMHLAIGLGSRISVYAIPKTEAPKEVTTRWSGHTGRVTGMDWSADGQWAVSGGLDTNVFVWSLVEPGKRIKASNAHKDGVSGVAWVDDGSVVTCGADAAVKRWKVVL